ncbi:hypothetical protein ACJX0J_040912, partial [Zea mays]
VERCTIYKSGNGTHETNQVQESTKILQVLYLLVIFQDNLQDRFKGLYKLQTERLEYHFFFFSFLLHILLGSREVARAAGCGGTVLPVLPNPLTQQQMLYWV